MFEVFSSASSGLGAATAEHFARLGCLLSLTGRDEQNLAVTKSKCLEGGLNESQVLITEGDVTSEAEMENLVDATIKHFARI
uniref:Uncharacterized protein n=1 Tax=Romanomermis culicivorax TaxID=13658 RepID=A0A915JCF7_ROMCU